MNHVVIILCPNFPVVDLDQSTNKHYLIEAVSTIFIISLNAFYDLQFLLGEGE